jgi:uncharacterized membrane protein YoaK (UPF0700 family)
MSSPTHPVDNVAVKGGRHGPLPSRLLVLTVVTGLVDAVSYLKLGHVFVANMTGNVVFLGFAAAGATDFSAVASLVAIVAFMAGALIAGRIATPLGHHRARFLAAAATVQVGLICVALGVSLVAPGAANGPASYALITPLALAMGLQNAAARRLGVPDLTTTVLTLTLTGLAADSSLGGGSNPNIGRRLAATASMGLGAAVGAALIFHSGVSSVLATAVVLLALVGAGAYRAWSSTESWTAAAP